MAYQHLIASEIDAALAEKRRQIYLRPFIIFWLGSFIFEAVMLGVGIAVFSGTTALFQKIMWTLVFCPLGMGGAMGGLTNYYIVDNMYGNKAAHFLAILSVLVLGSCNDLCYNLDLVFGWFGAEDHFWWWHWRYLMIWFVGYSNGKLMFTDEGQEKLARWNL